MLARQLTALVVANTRYWLTVHAIVKRELARWREHAERIDDDYRRTVALSKLDDAGPHALITATLATLAPRRQRESATVAIVALEVMYDYLDALTEENVDLDEGRLLYAALAAPFLDRTPCLTDPYLGALAATCMAAARCLPAFVQVAPVAADVAVRCGEAQLRSHLAVRQPAQLAAWASPQAQARPWWEAAGGLAASVLAVHALIAVAAEPTTTVSDAHQLAASYLLACSLTTMLDSLLDYERDLAAGAHSYVAYYATPSVGDELARLAAEAVTQAARQPHGAHHSMTVAGIAGYYLSDPEARTGMAAIAAPAVRATLAPLVYPILLVFGLWRAGSRLRH